MAKIYLRIRWEASTEFLEFDPKELRPGATLKSRTEEFWDDDDGTYEYVVTCEDRRPASPGDLRVVLRYDQNKNRGTIPASKRREVAWGRTHLAIVAGKATVKWEDDSGDEDSGPGKCRVLDASLWKESKLVTRTTRERGKQADFRRDLLERDRNRCAISGTTFEPVLDAAHVIPHAGKGNASFKNGLILRCDLHRLFDNYYRTGGDPKEQWLRLTRDGKVELSEPVRSHRDYKRFHGKKIAESTYARIRGALKAIHQSR